MSIVLYAAPDCLRCKITKGYMNGNNISYETFDLQDDKDIVNKFYRDNRARLYRNPEGAEFPMFHDVDNDEIRQGTGLILAYLLSGHGLDACVTRSELLHGWISGLDVSKCPADQGDKFLELVRLLAKGGLTVQLVADGNNADLLEKILNEDLVKRLVVNVYGPASAYEDAGSKMPGQADMKKTIELAQKHPNAIIRLWVAPLKNAAGEAYYITPDQAGEAAKFVAEASSPGLAFQIQVSEEKVKGLEEVSNLLPYRSKVRSHLPKTEITKEEATH